MILVVGAGPAGLAVAYYLQQRRLPYQVLEHHTVGYAWRNHYDRLHLHTLKQVSHLPGLPMPADYPAFPSATQFQSYLERYARRLRLNIVCGVDVTRADWTGERWQLETSQGAQSGTTLIVATGIWSTPYRPKFICEETFNGTMMHARDYHNPEPFQGQRVLVVGAGNSGTEIAVDLSEHGVATSIAIRSGTTFIPHPRHAPAVQAAAWFLRTAPRPAGEWLLRRARRDFRPIGIQPPDGPLLEAYPVVGYSLPDAVTAGKITLYGGIARFLPDGVQFADGQAASFDTVILATGYRPSLQFVAHELDFDTQGWPRVDRYWRSRRNPQLICVGFRYPATEGWLQAIGRVARTAVRGIPDQN